jgi:hypothetical protein
MPSSKKHPNLLNSRLSELKTLAGQAVTQLSILSMDVDAPLQANLAPINLDLAIIHNELNLLMHWARYIQQQLYLNIVEYNLKDFLEPQVYFAQILAVTNKDLAINLKCYGPSSWAFDHILLEPIVRHFLLKSIQKAQKKITITSTVIDRFLKIQIEDDGDGLPVECINNDLETAIANNFALQLTQTILKLHHLHQHHGYLKLSDLGSLGGASYQIYLPG